jgi:hypothetical protein
VLRHLEVWKKRLSDRELVVRRDLEAHGQRDACVYAPKGTRDRLVNGRTPRA